MNKPFDANPSLIRNIVELSNSNLVKPRYGPTKLNGRTLAMPNYTHIARIVGAHENYVYFVLKRYRTDCQHRRFGRSEPNTPQSFYFHERFES